MERIRLKYKALQEAFTTLEKALKITKKQTDPDVILGLQDSEIQRFEYCADEFWKFFKLLLERIYGVHLASPRGVLRESFSIKLLDANELDGLLKLLEDRNHTSHGYRFIVSREILGRIPAHFELMKSVAAKQIALLENQQNKTN